MRISGVKVFTLPPSMELSPCTGSLPCPEVRRWNVMIKNLVVKGEAKRVLLSYVSMLEAGVRPDNYTYPILLKAASSYSCVGLAIHGQAAKTGFLHHEFVQTALVNMYGVLGCTNGASKIFNRIPAKDLVAWNSMLAAYTSAGQMDKAQESFDAMPSKDLYSYNVMIFGYAGIGAIASAKSVFDGMKVRDVVSWNSIISAYIRAGDVVTARELFRVMQVAKNVVTWNSLISGCLQGGLYVEAIDLFDEMTATDCSPDHVTVASALSASAHLGSLEIGQKVHVYAVEKGLASSPHVSSALIDMYAKCGCIERSLLVFYKSQPKDIYSWNAIISGLALHGYGYSAIKLFSQMRQVCINPDDITFIGLLSACSHSGLLQEGCKWFRSMQEDFRISPKLEHYGCLVDLLGRAGHLDLALQLINSMSFEPGEAILGALLSACVIHQNLEVGRTVVNMISSKASCLGDGELMMFSNLFASCGCWDEANRWREMMNCSGIVKTAGCSVVEVNGRFEKFLSGKD